MNKSETIVRLANITKRWGSLTAIDSISLDVKAGEILTLLGPSGCGKTTLMRIVGGFETPTSGTVHIAGENVTNVVPEKRPVNMVFQRYALFPHLDVFDNIGFGLRLKKLARADIREAVTSMLRLVQLEGYGNRWINQLSGGQSQRVALARALINNPEVLLLDEPLAALDLKIRHHMLEELKRIHSETGTTFIYVTHDQDEAMMLSDRVVLMNKGTIEQIGTPDEMYGAPKTLFCAKFFGETNIVDGTTDEQAGDSLLIDTEIGRCSAASAQIGLDRGVHLSIRPESISIAARNGSSPDECNSAFGVVEDVTFVGSRVVYKVRHGRGTLIKCQEPRTAAGIRFQVGSEVDMRWPAESVVVLPA
jgi:spermidine/putrescine transport system ATP-binding protein